MWQDSFASGYCIGHKDIVEILIRAGASLNQLDKYGQTAWHLANEGGHKGIADLINGAVKDRARAFVSGLHPRPGEHSPVQLLNGFLT